MRASTACASALCSIVVPPAQRWPSCCNHNVLLLLACGRNLLLPALACAQVSDAQQGLVYYVNQLTGESTLTPPAAGANGAQQGM